MDLTDQSFHAYLPWMLYDISTSCFISFDFELSGISMSRSGQAPKTQSLQDRYAENKTAAEQYQILQVGLTFCHEDAKNATYILKPYNINLSPLVDRSLDINRNWTFMSWSVEFLLGNQFSIDTVCRYGVRYLSREEETQALERARQRHFPEPVKSVELTETDEESMEFIATVRHMINDWMKGGKHKQDYLNIPPLQHFHPRKRSHALPKNLNNMQKWLVHQLVSAEYPGLTSKSKSQFVQLEEISPERVRKNAEEKMAMAKRRIQKHVGCRWLMEALVGGDLTDLEPQSLNALLTRVAQPKLTLTELADRLKARVSAHRPVLVGHNCFADLVFFHQCFLGPLPDTVEEFQVRMHELFPMVIDTKYLATYDCGSVNPVSSLEEINRMLAKVSIPKIEVDTLHSKYLYRKSAHEAGYDSMLAAIAFIKLSALLQQGKEMPKHTKANLNEMMIGISSSKSTLLQELIRDNPKAGQAQDSYGRLIDLHEDSTKAQCYPLLDAPSADTDHDHLVPRQDSEFWKVYGNRLRVFGTTEKILHLPGEMIADSEMTA